MNAPQETPPIPRSVLVAVVGNSPAVLTETLWALAHENPPVIPAEIHIITTTQGEQILRDRLLAPRKDWPGQRSVWQALRASILGRNATAGTRLTLAPVTLIHAPDPDSGTSRPLDDIRTPADNAAAAETIFSVVRQCTSDPDTRVIGLLSGGRKTMSALLHAVFSLTGRIGDRLLHILVNEPFDNPRLDPVFYFPGQPGPGKFSLPAPAAKSVSISEARLDLADVPLVALGEIVLNHTGRTPATFAGFARAAADAVQDSVHQTVQLDIRYSEKTRAFAIAHFAPVIIPEGRPAALCRQLAADAESGLDLAARDTLAERWEKTGLRYHRQGEDTSRPPAGELSVDDISNALNVVRKTLSAGGIPGIVIQRLFPKNAPIGLNRERVSVRLVD
ncbi:MAG: TIGR02584 family CRISPR-associated protein [Puniceicoccales bacterium]|jgi:CRISPR-associated protein (TIGR02584 family)|nr:TIGR02584 family CRISPR-associated protein [Puniceicoccales bacterium]